MKFLLRLFFTWLSVIIASYIVPGVHVHDFITALVTAAVLTILNVFIRPILIILTIPFTIFTLGLFLFVINAFIVMIGDKFVEGFQVDSFGSALFFSLILSISVSALESLDRKYNKDSQN